MFSLTPKFLSPLRRSMRKTPTCSMPTRAVGRRRVVYVEGRVGRGEWVGGVYREEGRRVLCEACEVNVYMCMCVCMCMHMCIQGKKEDKSPA